MACLVWQSEREAVESEADQLMCSKFMSGGGGLVQLGGLVTCSAQMWCCCSFTQRRLMQAADTMNWSCWLCADLAFLFPL